MKTLPVAVQVYSVREDAEKDFAGTMKKIKEIGYDGVELAGLYGLEPAAIKAAIEDAGLVALSAHVPFQELVADMEGTIQKYVEIGMKYIAIPYLMEEDRPGTPKFEGNVKLFEEIAKACKAKGSQLLYHNHDFEFQKMADGRYALDYIYDTTPAIRRAMDQLINGTLAPENHQLFQELYHALLFGDNGGMADPYFVLKDLPSFLSTQRRVGEAYLDRDKWLKMAVTNTAKSGIFAADRTIAEYNEKIWHLEPLEL